MKRFDQSVLSYRKGVEVAERYLGPKHAICITLKNSLVASKKAAAAQSKGTRGAKKAAPAPGKKSGGAGAGASAPSLSAPPMQAPVPGK